MRFNGSQLFKDRFSTHMKETSRYLKYMFNGHIAVAMLFLISALSVYYQQWLAQLPAHFPTAWVMGITLGLIVTFIPVRTLLKEPDLVFLIAAEHQMNTYFRNTLWYSYLLHAFVLLFVFAVFSPLYMHTFPERSGMTYLLTMVIIYVFLAWNLIANWWMLKTNDSQGRYIEYIIRVLMNSVTFFFIIDGRMLLASLTTILFIVIFLYDYYMFKQRPSLNWELLVEKDRQRMHVFYRIANMFTDVPHIKSSLKKRHWLVAIFSRFPLEKKFTYDYLYRITFIRSGDYVGMYMRLMMIGGLFIWFVPQEWMKLIFAFLFMYMSTFQMMTLYHHFRTQLWIDLYPVDETLRKQAVKKWLLQLAFIQTVIFAFLMLMTTQYVGFGITLIGGFAFNFLLIQYFSKYKW